MALFATLALVGGALADRSMAIRKPSPLHLVDALIDGEPKGATLLPPKTQQPLRRMKTVSQDLFGDTRQQQQQALNTTYAGDEEQDAETTARQNLLITTTGLGLATAGLVLSPLFYLPSALCALYATRMFFQDAWDFYQREKRLDYRAIWALTVPVALAGGFVWTANFGIFFGLANYYLVSKNENRAKRTVADLFGGQINTVWLLVDGVETAVSKGMPSEW